MSRIAVKPTVADRVVSWISPQAGLRRMHARAMLGTAESHLAYTGARRDRPQTQGWWPFSGSADADTLDSLPALRTRSRDLVRNAPIAAGAIQTTETHVVGTGLKVNAAIDRELLGLTPDEEDAWERRAERIFRIAARTLDYARRRTFGALQWTVLHSVLESGDILSVRRNRRRKGDILSTKVQLVEADRISNPNMETDTDERTAGVQMDETGAPVRYHIQNTHPGDFRVGSDPGWTSVPAWGPQSGERMAWLAYRPTRPGQTRGVPFFAPVIEALKQLADLGAAELHAAMVNALFTMIYRSSQPEDGGFVPPTPDGGPNQRGEYKLGSGLVIEGEPGDEFEFVDPKRPNVAFADFTTAWLRQIGAALGIPFELLVKHFTASYSAAQAALLEAWKFFHVYQQWLVDEFCQPVYELVIAEAVAEGLIGAPGFFDDPMIRRAWLGASWIGPGRGLIRPDVEVRASALAVDKGFTTLEAEIARIYGGTWEQVHEQRVREKAARLDSGLDAAPAMHGAGA